VEKKVVVDGFYLASWTYADGDCPRASTSPDREGAGIERMCPNSDCFHVEKTIVVDGFYLAIWTYADGDCPLPYTSLDLEGVSIQRLSPDGDCVHVEKTLAVDGVHLENARHHSLLHLPPGSWKVQCCVMLVVVVVMVYVVFLDGMVVVTL